MPFCCGLYTAVVSCLMLHEARKFSSSSDTICGPLLDIKVSGFSKHVNVCCNHLMMHLDVVSLVNITSGYFVWWSMSIAINL